VMNGIQNGNEYLRMYAKSISGVTLPWNHTLMLTENFRLDFDLVANDRQTSELELIADQDDQKMLFVQYQSSVLSVLVPPGGQGCHQMEIGTNGVKVRVNVLFQGDTLSVVVDQVIKCEKHLPSRPRFSTRGRLLMDGRHSLVDKFQYIPFPPSNSSTSSNLQIMSSDVDHVPSSRLHDNGLVNEIGAVLLDAGKSGGQIAETDMDKNVGVRQTVTPIPDSTSSRISQCFLDADQRATERAEVNKAFSIPHQSLVGLAALLGQQKDIINPEKKRSFNCLLTVRSLCLQLQGL